MTTRILLIDDDPTVRFKYETLLRHAGMDVDTAKDGEEALEFLGLSQDEPEGAQGPGYHVVVSDLNMPGLDGLGLVSRIRAIPRLQLLPVLMLTASTDEEDVIRNLGAGATDYVVKTCSNQEFLARVNNFATISKLQAEVEYARDTDQLTNLANRRAGHRRLLDEIGRAQRYERDLAVGLIDIDHFKRVNDSVGHLAGDEVLAHVAATLTDVSRDTDCVIRWGGEEFLFVFPETTVREAAGILERFRAHVADHPVTVSIGDRPVVSITISGGVAQLEEGDTLETLVERADTALYGAKERGRNRLLMWRGRQLLPVCA